MVLAASDPDHTRVILLEPPANSKPGDRATYEGLASAPEPAAPNVVNKKKILEGVAPGWVTHEGYAAFKDAAGVAHFMLVNGERCGNGALPAGKIG